MKSCYDALAKPIPKKKLKKKLSPLQDFFNECKKGEYGVMPYNEGSSVIEFVWTNKKGWGRSCKIHLTTEGREEAWGLYQEIERLNEDEKEK